MAERLWYRERRNAPPEQRKSEEKPHRSAHEVERFGDLRFERYSPARGWYSISVEAERAAIDDAHVANNGARSIPLAHAVKEIEARLLVAGVALPGGRLEREAKLRGVTPAEMAAAVIERADEAAQVEEGRIKAKLKAVAK